MIANSAQRIKAKLHEAKGETLTEVLVAIVVSGLAILMLATVISAAANMNARSRVAMNEYFANANNVATASVNGDGTATMTLDGDTISLTDGAVDYRISVQSNNTPVVSYEAHN